MNTKEIIECLSTPDIAEAGVGEMEVVFDTSYASNLELLSVYVYKGAVHVDIGEV